MAVLERVGERAWALPGGVNLGLLRGEGGRIVMIDAGLNETAAKRALKAAREDLGGEVVAVLTTHGHADHFGGNHAVVKRTGARVHAPAPDEAVLRYPVLQPALLYGGADPIDTMRGPFMLAHAGPVDEVVAPGPLRVEGIDLEVIDLRGHSPGQVGYLVDGAFFCADVVLPESVLDKYRVPYLYSLTDHLAALDRAAAVACATAVPGHGPLLDRDGLAALVATNRALLDRVAARVLELAREPATADAILTGLLRGFASPAADAPGFYLLQPTAFAFLSHLHREGLVTHEVRDGQALWTAV